MNNIMGRRKFLIEMRKLLVFLVVTSIFMYMMWINFRVLNKYSNKKILSAFMISGLGLISVGTFLDVLADFMNIRLNNIISTCFTAGAIVFGLYIVLWTKYLVNVISSLYRKAHNDTLTGVYNRSGFEKVFEEKISQKPIFYIMVFDLDETKMINDTFGHVIGDEYIISAANIIQDEIGKNGFVGRTGGDEFVACLESTNEIEIERVKFKIKRRVANIFNMCSTEISIGHSIYGRDAVNMNELFKIADKRMYEDKKSRKKIDEVNKL